MPDVQIKIDVAGEAAGVPGDSRTFAYSKISGGGVLVSLSLGTTTGITQYFWELVDQPPGAAAVLNDPTSATPTFTAVQAKPGTYLIRCSVNSGQSMGTNGLAFTTEHAALRPLAAMESVEFGTSGWTDALNDAILASDTSGAAANAILKTGSVAFEANQPMGGYKLTGLGAGASSGDSIEYDQFIAALGGSTIDSGYNNFGASPARVVLDNAEGQGPLTFEVNAKNEFVVDISSASDPDSSYYGLTILCGVGQDYFTVGRKAANQIEVISEIETFDLTTATFNVTGSTIDIYSSGASSFGSNSGTCTIKSDANKVIMDGVGVTVLNRLVAPAAQDVFIDYDYSDSGNGTFKIVTNSSGVTNSIITCTTDRKIVMHQQLLISSGTVSDPGIAFSVNSDCGFVYTSTLSGTIGSIINGKTIFAVYHYSPTVELDYNIAVAFAEVSPDIPIVGTNRAYIHGPSETVGVAIFSGLSSTGVSRNYVSLETYVSDDTNTSEDAEFRVQTLNAGSSVTQLFVGAGIVVGDFTSFPGYPGAGFMHVENQVKVGDAAGEIVTVGNTGGQGYLEFSQGGEITTTVNGDVVFVTNGTGIVKVGNGSPANLTPTSGELYVSGKTEIAESLYLVKSQSAATGMWAHNASDNAAAEARVLFRQGTATVRELFVGQYSATHATTPYQSRGGMYSSSTSAGLFLAAASVTGTIDFYAGEASPATKRMSIEADGTIKIGSTAYTLPNATGIQNQVLRLDGSDVLQWTTLWACQDTTVVNAATYAALSTDATLLVTYSLTGTCTVTISTALISVVGYRIEIKDAGLNSSANNITIATEGSETIEGQPSAVINGNGNTLTLVSDGSNLFII